MKEKVIALLMAFGVTVLEEDPLLEYVQDNAIRRICNLTNRSELPDRLTGIAVSMAAGEYLSIKKACGQLEGFDLTAVVKQIQEGDTSMVFAVGNGNDTPEQRLNSLIEYLMNGRTAELYRYRRLSW